MTQDRRKFWGIFITLGVLVLWAGVATALYDAFLVGFPPIALILYFLVMGMGWLVPAMAIIRWMAKPDA